MTTIAASLITVLSAAFTHASVRGTQRPLRLRLAAAALLCQGLAVALATPNYGFWPGAYTMTALFMACCSVSPWIMWFWRQRRAG